MDTHEITDNSAAPDPVQAAYLAEASGDLVAMSFPGARRIAGWLFWVVFPAFAISALGLVIGAFIQHVGHEPEGIKGSFVANRSCARGYCIPGGQFTSDDGSVKNESLLGDPRWKTGDVHHVVWNRKGVEVSELGSWDPTTTVIAGVAAVSYLAVVGWFAQGVWRDKRH